MKVVLFTAIGIQAGRNLWILANDFKFDIMLFLDIDKRLEPSDQVLEVKSIH